MIFAIGATDEPCCDAAVNVGPEVGVPEDGVKGAEDRGVDGARVGVAFGVGGDDLAVAAFDVPSVLLVGVDGALKVGRSAHDFTGRANCEAMRLGAPEHDSVLVSVWNQYASAVWIGFPQ